MQLGPYEVYDIYSLLYFQGYDSTGGMSVLLDHPAREDGVLIQVLCKQGAVPFVRTNIPQLMMT